MAKKVLVVDDEKLIVKGIRFSLEQDGMEVTCAYDGEEALHLADLFLKMIKGSITEEERDELEEASVLQDIAHMPARVKCAVLGWHTMQELLKTEEK